MKKLLSCWVSVVTLTDQWCAHYYSGGHSCFLERQRFHRPSTPVALDDIQQADVKCKWTQKIRVMQRGLILWCIFWHFVWLFGVFHDNSIHAWCYPAVMFDSVWVFVYQHGFPAQELRARTSSISASLWVQTPGTGLNVCCDLRIMLLLDGPIQLMVGDMWV